MEPNPIPMLVAALAGTRLAPLAIYAPLVVAVAAVLAAVLPQPVDTSPWKPARRLLDLLAMNVGAAKNATGPASAPPMPGGLLAALLLLGLGACSAAQVADTQAQLATVNAVVCQADKSAPVLVTLAAPVATAIDPAVAPAVAGAVQLDQALVHPAIVAACANRGAHPVGATIAAP